MRRRPLQPQLGVPSLSRSERPSVGERASGDEFACLNPPARRVRGHRIDPQSQRIQRAVKDVGADAGVDLLAIAEKCNSQGREIGTQPWPVGDLSPRPDPQPAMQREVG